MSVIQFLFRAVKFSTFILWEKKKELPVTDLVIAIQPITTIISASGQGFSSNSHFVDSFFFFLAIFRKQLCGHNIN